MLCVGGTTWLNVRRASGAGLAVKICPTMGIGPRCRSIDEARKVQAKPFKPYIRTMNPELVRALVPHQEVEPTVRRIDPGPNQQLTCNEQV